MAPWDNTLAPSSCMGPSFSAGNQLQAAERTELCWLSYQDTGPRQGEHPSPSLPPPLPKMAQPSPQVTA